MPVEVLFGVFGCVVVYFAWSFQRNSVLGFITDIRNKKYHGHKATALEGPGAVDPRGSRYPIIKEPGLEEHDDYGFWGLSPS